MVKKIEISQKTIIFTVAFLIALWFLYLIREIVLALFMALIIVAVLDPMVTKMQHRKIPRVLSVLVTYIFVLGFVVFAIANITPPLIEQTTMLVTKFPSILEGLGVSALVNEQLVQQFINQIGALPAQIAGLTLAFISNILAVITIFVFAFYLLMDRQKIEDQMPTYIGEQRSEKVFDIVRKLEKGLGGWARAQLTLMFAVGFLSFIGFTLLGLPFALALGILTGLLEIIPYLGPWLAATPAVIIGFSISPLTGVATAAVFFLIQQIESYVLTPNIMRKTTGINPIITLLALATGFRLGGLLGIIISIPIFIAIRLFVEERHLLKNNKKQ